MLAMQKIKFDARSIYILSESPFPLSLHIADISETDVQVAETTESSPFGMLQFCSVL